MYSTAMTALYTGITRVKITREKAKGLEDKFFNGDQGQSNAGKASQRKTNE